MVYESTSLKKMFLNIHPSLRETRKIKNKTFIWGKVFLSCMAHIILLLPPRHTHTHTVYTICPQAHNSVLCSQT